MPPTMIAEDDKMVACFFGWWWPCQWRLCHHSSQCQHWWLWFQWWHCLIRNNK
jgi:hypothetical protein